MDGQLDRPSTHLFKEASSFRHSDLRLNQRPFKFRKITLRRAECVFNVYGPPFSVTFRLNGELSEENVFMPVRRMR